MKNYYGSLCTEMYEILHESAPGDELNFYLSYAEKGMSILEPLCGSGRFLIPFLERGFEICGLDLSEEMLAKLKRRRLKLNFFREIYWSMNRKKNLIIFSFHQDRCHYLRT